jgi:flagellin
VTGVQTCALPISKISGDAFTYGTGDKNLNSSVKLLAGNDSQTFSFTGIGGAAGGNKSISVTLAGGTDGISSDQALQTLNSALSGVGITASKDASGFLQFTSGAAFTLGAVADTTNNGATPNNGLYVAGNAGGAASSAAGNDTGNSLLAVAAIEAAVSKLGTVQGTVGTAQNQLSYASNLAQSQITNYSSAESAIRDADVASEAANLTKAQVLQQASIAAMAQANSAPQAVLSLLKG